MHLVQTGGQHIRFDGAPNVTAYQAVRLILALNNSNFPASRRGLVPAVILDDSVHREIDQNLRVIKGATVVRGQPVSGWPFFIDDAQNAIFF